MTRRWYATPWNGPDRRVAGPFATYAEAALACVTLTDRGTVFDAFVQGRIPAWYVPRVFDVISVPATVYASPRAWADNAPRRVTHRATIVARAACPVKLPDVVYTYSTSELRTLCQALDIPEPLHASSKAGIIEHMEQQLAGLARKRA